MPDEKTVALLSEEQKKLIAEARHSSGEGIRLNIKYVSFNGKDGNFYSSTGLKNEQGKTIKENLGIVYQGIVLKNRCKVNVYDPKNPLATFRSDEFNDVTRERIKVYNGNSQLVGEGSYRELKSKIPGLSMEKILYIKEPEGEGLVKMSVGGMSIKPWFDYLKTFPTDDTSIRYITKFGGEDQSNDYGDFKTMTFAKGEVIDINQAIDWQRALDMALGSYRNVNQTAGESEPAYIEEDGEVKVEDIPF